MSFPAAIQLSDLNGTNGFRIAGASAGDLSGFSVSSAGDVNDDGIDDIVVGSYRADPNGEASGASYVVFGGTGGFPATLELSDLDGTNGFRIDGITNSDRSGRSVSAAGDVNGDDIDDLIVAAEGADPNGNGSGASYVVFGGTGGFAATLQLSDLDGTNGFRIAGVTNYDASGESVSAAGDVNGDGIDDVIVGAHQADPNGSYSGASYVVFGGTGGFPATLELSDLDGTNGFRIDGVSANDYSGRSVSAAGDVNGDDIDDIIVGARDADPNGNGSGSSYVVFGGTDGFAATLQLSALNGTNGFRIDGVTTDDASGHSVSAAGDVNGDGIDDVIVGAKYADPNDGNSGSSYVVFGGTGGFGATVQLSDLDGTNGFRIDGVASYDQSGISVSAAGDVNGDGIDDVIVGASTADPNGNGSGSSYVVFGGTGGFAATLQLSALDGTDGFRIDGVTSDDRSGISVSTAGDVNGDGIDDVVVGAYYADPNGSNSGASYVLFGFRPTPQPTPPPAGGNRAPEAADDAWSVVWNNPLTIPAPGVLGNDTDADGDPLSVAGVVTAPGHGVLSWSAEGGFTYMPNAAYVGDDSFVYRVTDGQGGADEATVAITVLPDPTEAPRLPVWGGFGDERFWGTYQADTAYGGDGADTIWGGSGRDQLNGNTGNDRVLGGGDEDVVWGGQGNDLVDGGHGNDWVLGDRGDDTVLGGTGNDHAWGGQGDDLVLGGAGHDVLHGGLGADTLDGGMGLDLLTGGADADAFVFAEGCGLDRVTDFSLPAGDRIVIDTGGDGVLNGIAFASFVDIQERLVDGPDGVFLWLGAGPEPVHGVTIQGVTRAQLTADDFLIL